MKRASPPAARNKPGPRPTGPVPKAAGPASKATGPVQPNGARHVTGQIDPIAPIAPQHVEQLGTRLKHARLVRGLTLKALAGAAGCSESMLSKVENGAATPSLATLHRLATALSTNVAGLVSSTEASSSPVQRAGDRPIISFPATRKRGSIKLERVIVRTQGQLLQGDIHIIEPHASSDEQISHAGEETGYLIEGALELALGSDVYRLSPGDTFYFSSMLPHSYRNPGETLTRVWWVNTPPTF